jgi:hypothetical protein
MKINFVEMAMASMAIAMAILALCVAYQVAIGGIK